MRPVRAIAPVLACLLLAGCALTPQESQDGSDPSEYVSGLGLRVVLANEGEDPFRAQVRVQDGQNRDVAWFNSTIAPGDRDEKNWKLDAASYGLKMFYQWEKGGFASSGQDAQRVDLRWCPELTQVEWAFRQFEGTVGSAYQGSTCASPG